RLVSSFVRPALELWLNQHVDYGRKLAELAIKAAQSRQKAGQKVEKRKGSGVAVLPGKLTDCESRDIARDKECQAVLPLRGKVLNTWEVERDRLFANNEIHDIAVAIGVDPHGPMDNPDLSGLRYGKVCILSDADVDGSHIQVLLLTLFFRHFPKLIEAGHVYVARPPLFRVDVPARGKKPASKCQISRFKGLGEMSAEQLWDTTLNPDTRRLMPVILGTLDASGTEALFTKLMGKGEAASRRELMELHGDSVEVDV
ncbi:MAG: toprim domain-containing protein, partial [Hydrogenophaga sp.]|nr:toprim domain-containing protein [Hydrogenophaga sp.]